jgi:hypothetical protein
MRTDLTEMEHKLLHHISRVDKQGFAWLSRDEDEVTNSCLSSLVDRGLVTRENGWFISITEDGKLLIRMYGKP